MKKSADLRTPLLVAALILYCLYTIVRFGIIAGHAPGIIPTDFTVSLQACHRFLRGQWWYQHDDSSPFKYSPSFLLIFYATFFQLEKHWAWASWVALSIGSFTYVSYELTRKALQATAISSKKLIVLLAAGALFGFHGYLEHFSYGQADYLILSAFLGAAVLAMQKRAWAQNLAAFAMALALITKPPAALLLAYFFMQRQWALLLRIGVAATALMFFPVLGWGWERQKYLLDQWKYCIVMQQTPEFLVGTLNQNPAAVLARLTDRASSMLAWSWVLLTIAGVSVLAATAKHRFATTSRLSARLACIVVMLYCLVTPLSWRWLTFVWTPVFLIVGADALKRSASLWLRVPLVMFALVGVLLQSAVARALGIKEPDVLSHVGLYFFENLMLFWAAIAAYSMSTPSKS